MSRLLLLGLLRLLCGATVNWKGTEPVTGRSRIYFANHTSHLDALVIWSALPRKMRDQTRPVAGRDYWTQGRLRYRFATEFMNVVLIERKHVTAGNNPVETMLQALREGSSLILFPEGTRSASAEPGPFKSGLYHLAKHCPDTELVPVFLENLNRVLPKGEFLPVPMLCSITVGSPLQLLESETKADFLERARKAVSELQHA